ncbi:hypothetical protein KAR91_84100 [Candidatus Pacearchaeota archaeon]|nr:hypothetical protein [Candidatus Pacearchaeota archaeon]
MREQKYIPLRIPFVEGINEVEERGALPTGTFSRCRNMRWVEKGLEQRLGQTPHHTANTDNTNEITSLFSFSKGRITERSLFAQYSNGNIRKATDNPPAATTGEFGASVLAARTGSSPASWASFKDYLLMADGAGQAQIYTGAQQPPVLFNVYKGSVTIPNVPEEGADYTQEVIDGLSTTVAELDSLSTLANYDALFVGFATPVNKITFTIPAVNVNASVATLSYRKSDSTWADSNDADGTILSGASMGQTGSFTWTLPSDEIPHYAFGGSLFWYRITFSAALDAEVEVSAVTGENTAGFQSIINLWDGALVPAIEAIVQDSSASTYYKYSSRAIQPGEMVGAASHDYIYISSLDPLFGLYLDVGNTPNTTATTTIDQVASWTGTSFTNLTPLQDGTGGGANSGYVTWTRNPAIKKFNFKSSLGVPTYWYRIRFDKTLSASLSWAISTLPYFDINNTHYPVAQSAASWHKRAWYSFNDNHVYGTAKFNPTGLNGFDTVKVSVGDNRANKIICMRKFHNFLLVWQEEKGEEGGGFHIIEPGLTATGYDSQVISDRIGILNSKCAVVLEDVEMRDLNINRPVMKGVYFVSRYGVYKSDGGSLKGVSGGISNYFKSKNTECIRAGYEGKHSLTWDSMYGILRLALVSGPTATEPNKFFIFNSVRGIWAEDTLGQPLSCMAEVEAVSGNVPVLQYGGGQDGFVYRVNITDNDTDNDASTAIDADVIMELDSEQDRFIVKQELLKSKVQSAGAISRSVSVNGNTAYEYNRTIKMTERVAGETYRREEKLTDLIEGEHLSFRWRNNEISEKMYLLDVEFRVNKKLNR